MPTGGTALGALRTRVRKNLNQSSAPSDTNLSWQDADLNQFINDTIDELNPDIGIKDYVSSGFLTISGQYVYNISSTNYYNVQNVEIWNSGNSEKLYREINWKADYVSGNYSLIFDNAFTDSNYVIQMYGAKRIPFLSADGVSSECTRNVDQCIVLGATTKAFRAMLADRIQFNRYMTKIQQQEGRTRDILLVAREFEAQYQAQLEKLSTPGGAGFLQFIGSE